MNISGYEENAYKYRKKFGERQQTRQTLTNVQLTVISNARIASAPASRLQNAA